MTKQDLQKELLEKVKEGVKPSDFRKLKRSKSEGDIPKAPPLSKLNEMEQLKKENEQLKQEVQATAERLNTPSTDQVAEIRDLNVLLTDQLKAKQQEVEDLRKQLEETNPISNELSESDQSLISRHKSLKD